MGAAESKQHVDNQGDIALLSLRDWGLSPAKVKVDQEATIKELLKVQRRALRSYKFLTSVYESVLITDVSKPDNPIVFVNDNFEKMTLYTREEVLGRNCRFLQGRYTDKETVAKVRQACREGKRLDVELLNYRKDGVPFWNRFLMLPIYRKSKMGKKKLTHFIAIQKDVTFLRKADRKPLEWSPVEVALWLETIGLGKYGESMIAQKMDGQRLLTISDRETLQRYGVIDEQDQSALLKNIEFFTTNAVPALYPTLQESILSNKAAVRQFDSLSDARDRQVAIDVASTAEPAGAGFWNHTTMKENRRVVADLGFAIKCFHDGHATVILVNQEIKLAELQQKIHQQYKGDLMLELYLSHDGDNIHIQDDGDLANAFSLAEGNTLHVILKESTEKRPKAVVSA